MPARLNPNANLLPPVSELRDVSLRVAQAVAMQARREGLTEPMDAGDMYRMIRETMWTPAYRPFRRKDPDKAFSKAIPRPPASLGDAVENRRSRTEEAHQYWEATVGERSH